MFWCFGCEACRILAPWPGVEPAPSALEGEVLKHWTIRKVPRKALFLLYQFWRKNLREWGYWTLAHLPGALYTMSTKPLTYCLEYSQPASQSTSAAFFNLLSSLPQCYMIEIFIIQCYRWKKLRLGEQKQWFGQSQPAMKWQRWDLQPVVFNSHSGSASLPPTLLSNQMIKLGHGVSGTSHHCIKNSCCV